MPAKTSLKSSNILKLAYEIQAILKKKKKNCDTYSLRNKAGNTVAVSKERHRSMITNLIAAEIGRSRF